jgi:competence protein ComEA
MNGSGSQRREWLIVGGLLALIGGSAFAFLRPAPAPVVPALERTSVTVAVAGEVQKPGAYTLPFGSRVAALVQAAGGYTAGAEPSLVNPVQILTDGDQVRIPSKLAAQALVAGTSSNSSRGPSERVNVNTATQAQLEELPGVGPKMAARIIAARPIASMKDLDAVKGIGPSMLKKLEPFVRF